MELIWASGAGVATLLGKKSSCGAIVAGSVANHCVVFAVAFVKDGLIGLGGASGKLAIDCSPGSSFTTGSDLISGAMGSDLMAGAALTVGAVSWTPFTGAISSFGTLSFSDWVC